MNINFDEALERIREITGARTQVELAVVLNIRQSSISDAKRRGSLPDAWLITLFDKHNANPTWIRFGEGPKVISMDAKGLEPAEVYKRLGPQTTPEDVDELRGLLLQKVERMFPKDEVRVDVYVVPPSLGKPARPAIMNPAPRAGRPAA